MVGCLDGRCDPGDALRVSVYATAGDVLRYAATESACQQVLEVLGPLRVSRLFLEGRRGDDYVPPADLVRARRFFERHGIRCSGAIATVPGAHFGTRQNEGLGWLNWESSKTQADVAAFFAENAPLFTELIVDDFFCTGDRSPASAQARQQRSWNQYRRDLLVSLIDPLMLEPIRRAGAPARLIIKFPQWYDRFQIFGYDPPRMAAAFSQVWVGTEVRNPKTRRMGFVQPTEGYVNFRWLSSIAGDKVVGAWFDHIECTPQNFVDQAFQSVLAGARELTLFHLGDLVEGHAGDRLLAAQIPELTELAAKVHSARREGIPFYKPAGSDAEENVYLMDYLAMLGLPILPVADFPNQACMVLLGAQAGADSDLTRKIHRHLQHGGSVALTPALIRKLGTEGEELAGLKVTPHPAPALGTEFIEAGPIPTRGGLAPPLEVDAGLVVTTADSQLQVRVNDVLVPLLTLRKAGNARVFTLNIRTFSERDFIEAQEWLLAPKLLGWSQLPQRLADRIREELFAPPDLRLEAPAGVGLYSFETGDVLYNFHETPVAVRLRDHRLELKPHQCLWRSRAVP